MRRRWLMPLAVLTALTLAVAARAPSAASAPPDGPKTADWPAPLRGVWLLRLTSVDGGKVYLTGDGKAVCEVSATEVKFTRKVDFAPQSLTVKECVETLDDKGTIRRTVRFEDGTSWELWQKQGDGSITVMIHGGDGEKPRETYRMVVRIQKQ